MKELAIPLKNEYKKSDLKKEISRSLLFSKIRYCAYCATYYFNTPVRVQSLPVPSNSVLRGCFILKIVYRICYGMNAHKSFVVVCIVSTNEQGVTTYKSKRC